MKHILMIALAGWSVNAWSQTPEMEIQKIVESSPAYTELAKSVPSKPVSIATVLQVIKTLESNPEAKPKACAETTWVPFAGRYAISYDKKTNQPCRIYDLTFPTLSHFWSKSAVTRVPVEAFTAKDYLNWIRGNYAEVYKRIDERKAGFNAAAVVPASWVSKVKFKSGFKPGKSAGLPTSFKASDLEVGQFAFSAAQQKQLRELAVLVDGSNKTAAATFRAMADKPGDFLGKFKFIWNDLEKVYDVFMEGEFLPINGPVSLVDYNNQYKHALEGMMRSAVTGLFKDLVKAVPEPLSRTLVGIALQDSIDFLNMVYVDRAFQLEEALRAAMRQDIRTQVSAEHLDKGLNILFGAKTDLMSQYLISMIQTGKFNWNVIEKIGYNVRYAEEKKREIRRNTLNSNLVLREGCAVETLHDSFVYCSFDGRRQSVRSIISQNTILLWDLGSVMVHNFPHPYEVVLKRSVSWLLSAGLRVASIPLPKFVTSTVITALRDYSVAGMPQEATLRGHLTTQKWLRGKLDDTASTTLKWLYIQNINPFLPKTEAIESRIVQTNAARIGMDYGVLMSTK